LKKGELKEARLF